MLKKLDHPPHFFEKGMQAQALIYLSCKLQSKISDDAWQMILNRPNLGKGGVSCALNELRFVDFSVRSFDV